MIIERTCVTIECVVYFVTIKLLFYNVFQILAHGQHISVRHVRVLLFQGKKLIFKQIN